VPNLIGESHLRHAEGRHERVGQRIRFLEVESPSRAPARNTKVVRIGKDCKRTSTTRKQTSIW
jgi:hypothetical protein